MDDLISRRAAIAMCRKPCMRNADCSDFEMEIMMLPSAQPEYTEEDIRSAFNDGFRCGQENMEQAIKDAQPERIKGRWEQDGHHIKCDQCGELMCDRDREGWNIPKNYCPNCGAKMEVTE